VRPELQPLAFPRGRGFQHAVACFLGAAALADYHGEGFSHPPFQLRQHLVHAIRIGVIEEIRPKPIGARLAQRIGHELRAEGGAANADDQQIFKRTGRALDLTVVDFRGKCPQRRQSILNFLLHRPGRRQLGRAQPVMADHALLIRIGYTAFFELGHRYVGALHARLHAGEIIVRKEDATDVEGQAQRRELQVMALESIPELRFGKLHSYKTMPRCGPESESFR
jgi:hypothetical protein